MNVLTVICISCREALLLDLGLILDLIAQHEKRQVGDNNTTAEEDLHLKK
jgi:hypothetical protein